MRFRLLTFDVNYTILRIQGTPGQQYAKIAKTCGINVHPQALDCNYKVVWKLMKKEYPSYGINQGMSTREWWAEFVARIFFSAGVVTDHKSVEILSNKLYAHFYTGDGWMVYPHSHSMLQLMKDKGLQLGVLSNFDERLGRIMKDLNLDGYFDFVLTTVDAKEDKPHPRMFQMALDKARVLPEKAAHVGDDIIDDYWGARRMGITPFLLNRDDKFKQEDLKDVDTNHVITSLAQLEKHIS